LTGQSVAYTAISPRADRFTVLPRRARSFGAALGVLSPSGTACTRPTQLLRFPRSPFPASLRPRTLAPGFGASRAPRTRNGLLPSSTSTARSSTDSRMTGVRLIGASFRCWLPAEIAALLPHRLDHLVRGDAARHKPRRREIRPYIRLLSTTIPTPWPPELGHDPNARRARLLYAFGQKKVGR